MIETPPKKVGPLARHEARLAKIMLSPTLIIVAAIVAFPLLANFWISFKPITLGELRPPKPIASKRINSEAEDIINIQYRVRNSSQFAPITDIEIEDTLCTGLDLVKGNDFCKVDGLEVTCFLDKLEGKGRTRFNLEFTKNENFDCDISDLEDRKPQATGTSSNILTNSKFTLQNFKDVFQSTEFFDVLKVSMLYTIFGTLGAIVMGLFAALCLNRKFAGRSVLRGILLFPYVAPVIAVAFTWVVILDPFSGSLNSYLMGTGIIDSSINFFGSRYADFSLFGFTFKFPLALSTVIAFEAWRYFPLSFLFILARMQSVNQEMYEAAEIDGASPLQQFRYISLPQLMGIMSVLFLLRFIWTFNKFDDIFLLTGGAAGTRTLIVSVYEQAFAVSNLGAGAAVAVVVFVILLSFSMLYFRFISQEEGS